MLKAGRPGATCTWTSTGRTSMPSNDTVETRWTISAPDCGSPVGTPQYRNFRLASRTFREQTDEAAYFCHLRGSAALSNSSRRAASRISSERGAPSTARASVKAPTKVGHGGNRLAPPRRLRAAGDRLRKNVDQRLQPLGESACAPPCRCAPHRCRAPQRRSLGPGRRDGAATDSARAAPRMAHPDRPQRVSTSLPPRAPSCAGWPVRPDRPSRRNGRRSRRGSDRRLS